MSRENSVEMPVAALVRRELLEGEHVIQSLESGVYGVGDDWEEAERDFWNHMSDLHDFLDELVRDGEATDYEVAELPLLANRLKQRQLVVEAA